VGNRSELSPSMTLQGPPTKKEEAVKAFKKKHAKTMVQGNRICAVIKRPYQKIDALVKDAIMAENVASRVKGIALRKINAKF
jgi:ribosomal protein S20